MNKALLVFCDLLKDFNEVVRAKLFERIKLIGIGEIYFFELF